MATFTSYAEYGMDYSNGVGRWDILPALDPFYFPFQLVTQPYPIVVNNTYSTGTHTTILGDTSVTGGAVYWTTSGSFGLLNTVTLLSSDNAIIAEISGLVGTPCPAGGITSLPDLGNLILSGDDTLIGSSGRDWMEGKGGNDTFHGSAGADVLFGGLGDDVFLIGLGDFGAGDKIYGGGDPGDTIRLQNAGAVDLRQTNTGTFVSGISGLDFDTGASTVTIDPRFGTPNPGTVTNNLGSITAVDGSPNTDTLTINKANGGYDYSTVAFTHWATGEDKIFLLITAEGGPALGVINGTTQPDTFVIDYLADNFSTLKGNDGDDIFEFRVGGTTNPLQGGTGFDSARLDGVEVRFGEVSVEQLVFAGAGSKAIVEGNLAGRPLDYDASTVPTIVGSSNVDALVFRARNLDLSGLTLDNWTDKVDTITIEAMIDGHLIGSSYADTLKSINAATCVLEGRGGDDTYLIINASDVVDETGGDGSDTVMSAFSFSLADGSHVHGAVERLTLTGLASIDGTGSGLENVLTGNAGDNVLNGGALGDTMLGGAGTDTYVVDSFLDTVDERNNGGAGSLDLVQSSVTFSLLASAHVLGAVERLTLTGTAAIKGTGNALNNTIIGNGAANVLNGGLGSDTLSGGVGTDTLIGGVGNDRLTGGVGNDFFIFDARLSASANKDTIVDFSNVSGNNDAFRLDNAVMAKLGGTGTLKAAYFYAGTAAHDADDHIIYNKATGALIYDSNGNAAGGAIQFATLLNKPALTHFDFVVI
jgi:Ca2+-binding RTX toxin-like protein